MLLSIQFYLEQPNLAQLINTAFMIYIMIWKYSRVTFRNTLNMYTTSVQIKQAFLKYYKEFSQIIFLRFYEEVSIE